MCAMSASMLTLSFRLMSPASTLPGAGMIPFSHAKVRSTVDPSARQGALEAFGVVAPPDVLDSPATFALQRLLEFWPCIATISKDMAQKRVEAADRFTAVFRSWEQLRHDPEWPRCEPHNTDHRRHWLQCQ